jgi:hypothetical protein
VGHKLNVEKNRPVERKSCKINPTHNLRLIFFFKKTKKQLLKAQEDIQALEEDRGLVKEELNVTIETN